MNEWLVALQRQFIYFPGSAVPPAASVLPTAQEVALPTEDLLTLGGWFVPAALPATGRTVLVCNGNAGTRADRAPLAAALCQVGLAVLLFDYRGYGGNPGIPSERGLRADARAARAYLATRGDVDPTRLIYLGESLGAAVAVGLATELPPSALVLRSPFTALVDVGRLHYPWLPVARLLSDRYAALEQIGQLRVPLFVVAGARDRIVPAALSQRLYEAAAGPKRLVVLPDLDHNDLALAAGQPFIEEVVRFLAEAVPGGSQSPRAQERA